MFEEGTLELCLNGSLFEKALKLGQMQNSKQPMSLNGSLFEKALKRQNTMVINITSGLNGSLFEKALKLLVLDCCRSSSQFEWQPV